MDDSQFQDLRAGLQARHLRRRDVRRIFETIEEDLLKNRQTKKKRSLSGTETKQKSSFKNRKQKQTHRRQNKVKTETGSTSRGACCFHAQAHPSLAGAGQTFLRRYLLGRYLLYQTLFRRRRHRRRHLLCLTLTRHAQKNGRAPLGPPLGSPEATRTLA